MSPKSVPQLNGCMADSTTSQRGSCCALSLYYKTNSACRQSCCKGASAARRRSATIRTTRRSFVSGSSRRTSTMLSSSFNSILAASLALLLILKQGHAFAPTIKTWNFRSTPSAFHQLSHSSSSPAPSSTTTTTSTTQLNVVSRHHDPPPTDRTRMASSSTTAVSSWSKAFSLRTTSSSATNKNNNSSSRLGVRKRVKAVLEKARNRTGLENRHSSSDATVVAEAASLGGFFESADFVLGNHNNNMNYYDNTTMAAPQQQQQQTLSLAAANNEQEVQRYQGRNGTDVNLSLLSNGPRLNGKQQQQRKNGVEVDAVLNSGKVEPLPFSLPKLSSAQEALLVQGERIQEQTKMGQEGSGFVVLEVPAPDYVVWECLLDFEKYPEYIDTVRSMTLFTNTHLQQSYEAEKPVQSGTGRETRHYGIASITRAAFTLSRKFRLRIAAVHEYRPHPNGHYMEFSLDRANRNVVLQHAKGIWYTQESPTRPGYTRVWLLCELKVSKILPKFIVDYAAVRAMPRASTWIPAAVEKVKLEFDLKK